MLSSDLLTVFRSSVAATVTEREEALIPDRPSLSGPSLPAALETATPASIASSSILLCMSVPSEPPFSWLVIPHDSEMMSMPWLASSTPGQASSLWSIIHCRPFIADS